LVPTSAEGIIQEQFIYRLTTFQAVCVGLTCRDPM
jgi:hypothetical protein